MYSVFSEGFFCKINWIRFAGRLPRNVVMTGNVLLNGKKKRLDYGVVVSNCIF